MSKGYFVPGLPSQGLARQKTRGLCLLIQYSFPDCSTNAHRLHCAGSWLKPSSTDFGMPYQRACVEQDEVWGAYRDELVKMGTGDVCEANDVLPKLGPACNILGAVQEGAHLLLCHAVQLLQEELGLPLQSSREVKLHRCAM